MAFLQDDDEDGRDTIVGIDVAQIAALLADRTPDSDAYDVLREVLTSLTEQSRDRRGTTH